VKESKTPKEIYEGIYNVHTVFSYLLPNKILGQAVPNRQVNKELLQFWATRKFMIKWMLW